MRSLGYRPALDGIRGLAITLVVCFHAFGWPRQGHLGVDLFFVLSGFLITSLLLEEWSGTGRIHLRGFYARRARRLLPALVVMLIPYLVIASALALTDTRWLFGLISALTYTSNILVASNSHGMPPGLVHLWSLAAEEQFYIVWPLLLLGLLRFGGSRIAGRGLVVLLVGLLAYRLGLVLHGASAERLYYAPDTHADPLVVGCLFGWVFSSGRAQRFIAARRLREVASLGALIFVVVAAVLGDRVSQPLIYKGQLVTVFAVIGGVLIISVAIGDTLLAHMLSVRPLRFLGQISYSLYLWHLPLFVALGVHAQGMKPARATAVIALAILVAATSRRLVELPFLRKRLVEARSPDRGPVPLKGRAVAPIEV